RGQGPYDGGSRCCEGGPGLSGGFRGSHELGRQAITSTACAVRGAPPEQVWRTGQSMSFLALAAPPAHGEARIPRVGVVVRRSMRGVAGVGVVMRCSLRAPAGHG